MFDIDFFGKIRFVLENLDGIFGETPEKNSRQLSNGWCVLQNEGLKESGVFNNLASFSWPKRDVFTVLKLKFPISKNFNAISEYIL